MAKSSGLVNAPSTTGNASGGGRGNKQLTLTINECEMPALKQVGIFLFIVLSPAFTVGAGNNNHFQYPSCAYIGFRLLYSRCIVRCRFDLGQFLVFVCCQQLQMERIFYMEQAQVLQFRQGLFFQIHFLPFCRQPNGILHRMVFYKRPALLQKRRVIIK